MTNTTQTILSRYGQTDALYLLSFAHICAFSMPSINYDLGVALKLSFFTSSLILLNSILQGKIIFRIWSLEEIFLMLFLSFYTFSGFWSPDVEGALRLSLAAFMMMLFYFACREIFIELDFKRGKRILLLAGCLSLFAHLVWYVAGVLSLGSIFELIENREIAGVIVDRAMPRLRGFAIDPNIFVFMNTILFAFFLQHRRGIFGTAGLVLAAMGVALSLSRGGLMGIVAAACLTPLLVQSRAALRMVVPALILLGTLMMAAIFIEPRIAQMIQSRIESAGELSGRLELWAQALEIFSQNFFLGIGAFGYLFTFDHWSHNTYLDVLVETGLAGFSLYLLFKVSLFVAAWRLARAVPEMLFVLFALMAMEIQALSLSLAFNEAYFLVYGMVVGLSLAYRSGRLTSALSSNGG